MGYPIVRSDVASGYRGLGQTLGSGVKELGRTAASAYEGVMELKGIEKDKEKFKKTRNQTIGEWKENLKGLPVEQWEQIETQLKTDDPKKFAIVNKELHDWYVGSEGDVNYVPLGKGGISGFGFSGHGTTLAGITKTKKEREKEDALLADATEKLSNVDLGNQLEAINAVGAEAYANPKVKAMVDKRLTAYQEESLSRADQRIANERRRIKLRGEDPTPKPEKPFDNIKDKSAGLAAIEKVITESDDENDIAIYTKAKELMLKDKTLDRFNAIEKAKKDMGENFEVFPPARSYQEVTGEDPRTTPSPTPMRGTQTPQASSSAMKQISTQAEYDSLPSGSSYTIMPGSELAKQGAPINKTLRKK